MDRNRRQVDHSRRATPLKDPFPDMRDQISHRGDRRRQEVTNCERTHAGVRSNRRASPTFDSNGVRYSEAHVLFPATLELILSQIDVSVAGKERLTILRLLVQTKEM